MTILAEPFNLIGLGIIGMVSLNLSSSSFGSRRSCPTPLTRFWPDNCTETQLPCKFPSSCNLKWVGCYILFAIFLPVTLHAVSVPFNPVSTNRELSFGVVATASPLAHVQLMTLATVSHSLTPFGIPASACAGRLIDDLTLDWV